MSWCIDRLTIALLLVPPAPALGKAFPRRSQPSSIGIASLFRPTSTTTTTSNMSLSSQSARPLACLKQALRQCRAERQQQQTRSYAAQASQVQYPSLQTRYPPPSKGFRTSQTTKQNREYTEDLSSLCNHRRFPQASKPACAKSQLLPKSNPPANAAPTP
jgi:hypothetical protein